MWSSCFNSVDWHGFVCSKLFVCFLILLVACGYVDLNSTCVFV